MTRLARLADRLISGGLERYLVQARIESGRSYASIAAALASDHDITVTKETVRHWCHIYRCTGDDQIDGAECVATPTR